MKKKRLHKIIGNKYHLSLNGFLLNKLLYIGIGLIFIIVSFIVFKWNHTVFNTNDYADNCLLGTFGDFVGGVLGTTFSLVSVLLVIKTFKEQQKVSNQNSEQLEVQRFNDLFFELLRLYQSEVNELCGQKDIGKRISSEKEKNKATIEVDEIKYNNKDFFDIEKNDIKLKYRNRKSYEDNRKNAVKYYMLFFITNSTKMGAYFRTLYRIYDLIDDSNINENTKKNYLKIMRAQLTDSELFFIRYNAMTYYGYNFIHYINKYHILKHLPAFELLEFKDWWSALDNVTKMGVNIIYDYINRLIRTKFSENSERMANLSTSTNSKTKYTFQVSITNKHDVNLILKINKSEINKSMEYKALDEYDDKKIQQLLDCFIKEIFLYSNFEKFNTTEDIKTYSSPILSKDNVTYINSGIKNKQGRPLVLCYSQT